MFYIADLHVNIIKYKDNLDKTVWTFISPNINCNSRRFIVSIKIAGPRSRPLGFITVSQCSPLPSLSPQAFVFRVTRLDTVSMGSTGPRLGWKYFKVWWKYLVFTWLPGLRPPAWLSPGSFSPFSSPGRRSYWRTTQWWGWAGRWPTLRTPHTSSPPPCLHLTLWKSEGLTAVRGQRSQCCYAMSFMSEGRP